VRKKPGTWRKLRNGGWRRRPGPGLVPAGAVQGGHVVAVVQVHLRPVPPLQGGAQQAGQVETELGPHPLVPALPANTCTLCTRFFYSVVLVFTHKQCIIALWNTQMMQRDCSYCLTSLSRQRKHTLLIRFFKDEAL